MIDDPAVEARRRYDAFHRRSLEDPDAFWSEAAQLIDWSTPPDRVFEQPEPPSFRWFLGGHTNLAYNALDRHVAAGRGDQTALIALNERGGRRTFTYRQLLAEVSVSRPPCAASASVGATASRSTCRPVAEAIVAMLATVRIGAIHSVVFAGFGSGALGDRIRASGSTARPRRPT